MGNVTLWLSHSLSRTRRATTQRGRGGLLTEALNGVYLSRTSLSPSSPLVGSMLNFILSIVDASQGFCR